MFRPMPIMFEQRLKAIMLCFAAVLAAVVLRLIDLQVVNADVYREQAERALLRSPKTLAFVRGRILDRFGRLLASDEPCWQVSIDYDVLAWDSSGIKGDDAEARDIPWSLLAEFGEESVEALLERRDTILERIRRWRRVASST